MLEIKPSGERKVKLDLTKVDGNAFSLMAAFKQAALREGWPGEDIRAVLDDAMSSDYFHLVTTLQGNCR
jgi:hypothetical protein